MGEDKSHIRMKNELALGDLTGKVSKDSNIAQSEKALVNVDSGTLYFPVLLDETAVGGIFLGSGQFIVEAVYTFEQQHGRITQKNRSAVLMKWGYPHEQKELTVSHTRKRIWVTRHVA